MSTDADRASQAIDELLHAASPSDAIGGTVHLHCTDVAGEWMLRPTADGLEVTRVHAKGDCALRGPAADLLRVLQGDAGLESIEVIGDAGVAASFLAALNP